MSPQAAVLTLIIKQMVTDDTKRTGKTRQAVEADFYETYAQTWFTNPQPKSAKKNLESPHGIRPPTNVTPSFAGIT